MKNVKARLKHYKKMLKYYEDNISNPIRFQGLCTVSTYRGVAVTFYLKKYKKFQSILPELYEQKPTVTFNHSYWWEPGDAESRKEALRNAISTCKTAIKNKSLSFRNIRSFFMKLWNNN